MKGLRGDRVLLEFQEDVEQRKKKDAYEQRDSGLFVPQEEEKNYEIKKATVILVSPHVEGEDLKKGMTVYAKKQQGEKVSPDNDYYLFRENFIIGND